MKFKTLRFRINLMTVLFSLMVMVVSSIIMFSVFMQLINARVEQDYMNKVEMIQLSLKNDIKNLNSIALLFTPYGSLGEDIISFNQTQVAGEKAVLLSEIRKNIGVINFSNPNIALCVFFLNQEYTNYITSYENIKEINLDEMPILYKMAKDTYYGPHTSIKKSDPKQVISLKKIINIGFERPTYVYIEYDFQNTMNLLDNINPTYDYFNIIINETGNIMYSMNQEIAPLGVVFNEENYLEKYNSYSTPDDEKWKIITLVKREKLGQIKKDILLSYLIRYPIFFALNLGFSFILVDLINRPLQRFKEGILQMKEGDFNTIITRTNISEFDMIIGIMNHAKYQISSLIEENNDIERKRVFAEISRLRAQINPHFLLNTLNTVHWIAIEHQQDKIDYIVQSLNKILAYNLKRDNQETTIDEEVEVTEAYIRLQQMKYSFDYQFVNEAGEEALQYSMPRFLLQPLVENSILHSQVEHLEIKIVLKYVAEGIIFEIKDNGTGLNDDLLVSQLSNQSDCDKLGIGLSYVFSALSSYYRRDDLVSFSNDHDGLQITILLPFEGGC